MKEVYAPNKHPAFLRTFLSLNNVDVHVQDPLRFICGGQLQQRGSRGQGTAALLAVCVSKPISQKWVSSKELDQHFLYGKFGLDPEHQTQSPI